MKTHASGPLLQVKSFFCTALLAGSVASTSATVTNVAWYRLGENDPGGTSGLTVTNTTADIIGVRHLRQFGNPLYANAVSATASNRLGSGLAIQFNGSPTQLLSNNFVSLASDNFGFEAWIRPDVVNSSFRIIIGNGTPGFSGWGLLQQDDLVGGYIGSQVTFGAPVSTGVWAHVAVVMAGGNASIYLNGQFGGTLPLPTSPGSGPFTVGGGEGTGFLGAIDEVRVFTFAPGQFSTNDLLFNLRSVHTLPAVVSGSSATLNAQVHPLGVPTSAWFEWGTTTNYGNTTPPQLLGSGFDPTNFSRVLTGLFGGIDYQFRAVASNHHSVIFGTNQSFAAAPFILAVTNLPGTYFSSVAWGDYDNDERLDILLTGRTNNSGASWISQVWRNTGNGFTNINAGLPGVQSGSGAWGDYDNDGRLDILLTGLGISQVWRNTGSGFANVNAGLPGVYESSAAWGDYDNDGRLDILLTGIKGTSADRISQVWRNTGSGFTNINAGLTGVSDSSTAWGDYNNDGQLDILLTGNNNGTSSSQVWRNAGRGFVDINAGLPGFPEGYAVWGDYDNDGLLDILVQGNGGIPWEAQVWKNTGSGFTNINAGLPGAGRSSSAWGDYDNDGRLDILLTGLISQVWRNTGSGFSNINAGLPVVDFGSVAWGDYDNDGRLDFLLTGAIDASNSISQVWRNNLVITNTPPPPPSGLTATVSGGLVQFSWNAASDSQTPSAGLTYNLRIGTTPGGSDIIAPSSSPQGWRRLPEMGNVQQGLMALFNYTPNTPYYWSVQAVDGAFAASGFAPEQDFRVIAPVVVPATLTNQITGDINLDGKLDDSELAGLLSNYYWSTSPWLYMTNVAGLGGTNVTFALTNSLAGGFSVEYSTNLADWYFLGPATPRYLFTDTNAPTVPQRHYRLRWP